MLMDEHKFETRKVEKRLKVYNDGDLKLSLPPKFPEAWVFAVIQIANDSHEKGLRDGKIEKAHEIQTALGLR